MVRQTRVAALALAATVALYSGAGAQSLALSLFERYLEPLRVQYGIPGLSAAIVQDGQVVWERGMGLADIEASLPARPDTPYGVGDITQTFTTLLLAICAERNLVQPDQNIGRWVPTATTPAATIRQILTHTSGPTGAISYDTVRFAQLTGVVESCTRVSYREALAQEVLDQLALIDAVPGRDALALPVADGEPVFDTVQVNRYSGNLARLAIPYRVDKRGRATRADLPPAVIDASYGLIASARDLAKFDIANDEPRLVRADTMQKVWTPVPTPATASANGTSRAMAMGWFIQDYEGHRLIWHFGQITDAYSALIVKVPARRLTLILLANSDGLSSGFSLQDGDVTSSLFARTFLRIFL
jgi:CubicO group peptidase (beta-lactamase class C family)